MESIALIGNMCSGKTTLCKHIAAKLGARTFFESVEDNPLLKLAYEDRGRYNSLLQFYFLFRRFYDSHQSTAHNGPCIFDRYFYDGPEVFVPTHVKLGNLTQIEADTIKYGYETLKPHVTPPTLLVYLRSEPDKTYERLRTRAKSYEMKSALNFIEFLNGEYELFFSRYALGAKFALNIDAYSLSEAQPLSEVCDNVIQKFKDLTAKKPREA